jgi:hypothetical protein
MKIKATLNYFRRDRSDLSGKYEVNLCNLSNAVVKALEKEHGVTQVRNEGPEHKNHAWGSFTVARSDYPVRVLDSKKRPIGEEVILGNGTVVYASVNPYPWNFKGKKGVSLGCAGIQVIEFVEYSTDASIDAAFEEEEGYEIEEPASEEDELPVDDLEDTDEIVL